jgi:hypothetical protein
MLAQERLLPLTFTKKDNCANSVLIDQFLKEAIQILRHANNSLSNTRSIEQETEAENGTDSDNESVTWELKLKPTMMTLETNILTVSGLEKVLELIRINVKPQPPRFRDKRKVNSHQFDISLFRHVIKPVIRLSTVTTLPRSLEQQYNPMQLMRHCVQSFIDCGYSFFLDVPRLVKDTEMILSQPAAAKEHAVETLLILSICTLMIRHSTIHHRGDMIVANALMHAYHAQARQLLQDLFDVPHISVVQSMFILSLFPQGHIHLFSPSRTKSPLLTMAVRMAMEMDLHKLDIQHNEESDQKEKLRRFAWTLLCADYYSEWNTTGSTGNVDVTDWHVDFPQPLPNEPGSRRVEFFSQYCRVIMIRKMELFKSAYMISLQSPKALESRLDEQLFSTYFNTPDSFKLDLGNPNQTWSNKSHLESLLLHELYSHTRIFAQIPFLPKRYIESFVADQDASRCADLNDIHQRISRLSEQQSQAPPLLHNQQFSQPQSATHLIQQQQTNRRLFATECDQELEFYCVVGCLTALNNYTLILEALTCIDTVGCHHSPVYGAMLTIHLYFMIERSCQVPEIRNVCQINLLRTQRILQQARSIYADPAILFLECMLVRNNILPNEDISICTLNRRTHEMICSLQAKSSYLPHSYENEEGDESHIKLENSSSLSS